MWLGYLKHTPTKGLFSSPTGLILIPPEETAQYKGEEVKLNGLEHLVVRLDILTYLFALKF